MQVTIVPNLKDNYAYLLSAENRSEAIVVDPGECEPIERVLAETGLVLVAVFLTHHHWDHTMGGAALLRRPGKIRVFGHGSDQERIAGLTDPVDEGERVEVAGMGFDVLHVPGHTRGAIAYVGHGCVFTGDTLFAAGCGRLFEGTAEELYTSLGKLARLPPETRVFCGHEYTEKNLAFAASLEPGNELLRQRISRVTALRAAGQPTVPTTIAEELATNPFLRTHCPEIRENLKPAVTQDAQDAQVFSALRTARNGF